MEVEGLEHASGWLVTYASETVQQGQPVAFVTVLIPLPQSVSGKELADSIDVTEQGDSTDVTLSHKH